MALNKYYQGEKIRLKGTVRDPTDSDNLKDPDSGTISVVDSAGTTKVNESAVTVQGSSSGVVYYDYEIPSDAELNEWTYQITVTDGNPSIEQGRFVVLEAV